MGIKELVNPDNRKTNNGLHNIGIGTKHHQCLSSHLMDENHIQQPQSLINIVVQHQ